MSMSKSKIKKLSAIRQFFIDHPGVCAREHFDRGDPGTFAGAAGADGRIRRGAALAVVAGFAF